MHASAAAFFTILLLNFAILEMPCCLSIKHLRQNLWGEGGRERGGGGREENSLWWLDHKINYYMYIHIIFWLLYKYKSDLSNLFTVAAICEPILVSVRCVA